MPARHDAPGRKTDLESMRKIEQCLQEGKKEEALRVASAIQQQAMRDYAHVLIERSRPLSA